jgi:hypothetical protein
MLGLTGLALGVGYFLSDAGYGLITLGATLVYWFAVVRPSQRAQRERERERERAKPG